MTQPVDYSGTCTLNSTDNMKFMENGRTSVSYSPSVNQMYSQIKSDLPWKISNNNKTVDVSGMVEWDPVLPRGSTITLIFSAQANTGSKDYSLTGKTQ